MQCEELVDLAPELALDIVCGTERAAALAHLDACGSCQQVVTALTGVSDQLLVLLAPSVEPPPGFERPFLEIASGGPSAVVRPRRWWPRLMAVAAVVCVALLAPVSGLLRSGGPSPVAAEMRTSGGAVVGTVF